MGGLVAMMCEPLALWQVREGRWLVLQRIHMYFSFSKVWESKPWCLLANPCAYGLRNKDSMWLPDSTAEKPGSGQGEAPAWACLVPLVSGQKEATQEHRAEEELPWRQTRVSPHSASN